MICGVSMSFAAAYEPSPILPPTLEREFRAAWIATVANIDWPSKPGLSSSEQKRELLAMLDRAAQLKLNAIIFQVRPMCDAFYASSIEPWSEYLTGTMGKAPQPFYDPLAFAVQEAHQRGLELHAWFNPFRAGHPSAKSSTATNHVSKTRPQLVKPYGKYLWLDPGEEEVRDYSLRVVMDVVKRYDIDGIQFDDYYYPERTLSDSDFPDNKSWKKYGVPSRLSRDDWRRENVNAFIERVYQSIKAAKPWVKFGISPRGIWRPGYPPQIKGMDAYTNIYADSRKWLASGWLDYVAPQLYWPIEPKEQSFPVLLKWWADQNLKGRHLWPGLAAFKADAWKPEEILNQIRIARKQPGASGFILYSMSSLMQNKTLAAALERNLNAEPALVSTSPWLGSVAVGKPNVITVGAARKVKFNWNATGTNSVRWWIVQYRTFGDWATEILPVGVSSRTLSPTPDAFAITALDRIGNASTPCVLQTTRSLLEKKGRSLNY
jgi:uncharacterized lipoprotein YddW (UPF0748 family)